MGVIGGNDFLYVVFDISIIWRRPIVALCVVLNALLFALVPSFNSVNHGS